MSDRRQPPGPLRGGRRGEMSNAEFCHHIIDVRGRRRYPPGRAKIGHYPALPIFGAGRYHQHGRAAVALVGRPKEIRLPPADAILILPAYSAFA